MSSDTALGGGRWWPAAAAALAMLCSLSGCSVSGKVEMKLPPRKDGASVTVLALTYNHGEACEVSNTSRATVVARIASEIETASRPDVVTISSQELRADDWFPLQVAIKDLPYVWVGVSDIRGRTKLAAGCAAVETAIQVAVREDIAAERLEKVMAEVCGESVVECEESTLLHERYYKWPFKQTKGHVGVHMSIDGLTLHIIGAHLDTRKFEANIKDYLAPALHCWKAYNPGVTIVAADFNNRIDPVLSAQLCSEGTGDWAQMAHLFQVNSSNNDFDQHFGRTSIQEALQSASHDKCGPVYLEARLARPATESGAALPTYKFPEVHSQVDRQDVYSQAHKLFGAEGSHICKDGKPKIGVLDSVAWVHAPLRSQVQQEGEPVWAKLPGSDHALVGTLLTVSWGGNGFGPVHM